MNEVRLVGLCGDIGAGKDSAADALVRDHGFTKLSYAAALKWISVEVYQHLGLEPRHILGTQEDKDEPIPTILAPDGEPRTGREIGEIVGTEGFRGVCLTTWTQIGMARAAAVLADGGKAVFTDTRFRTEFDAIREAGGVVWEVVKVGGEDTSRDHASDQEWRELRKDGIVAARAGDLEGLALEVSALLDEGGRRHERLLQR